MEDVVLDLKKQYPDDHSKAFATAWSIYNKKHGKAEEGCTSMEEAHVDTCRQSNPATADKACAMQNEGLGGKIVGGIAGARLAGPRGVMTGAEIGSGLQDIMNNDTESMFENVTEMDIQHAYQRLMQLSDSFIDEEEALEMVSRELQDQGFAPEEVQEIMKYVMDDLNGTDSEFDMMNGPDDFSDDADALASAGHGSDEDYGDFPMDEARGSDINPDEVNTLITLPVEAAKIRAQEIIAASTTSDNKKSYLLNQINRARTSKDVTSLMYNMILAGEGNAVQGSRYGKKFNSMEEGLNNGYDDVEFANGNDFFPNGADSPVVRATGPSGARQGDNPEQKRMQVAEVHKELVYGYRNFLKESASVSQKKKLTESTQVSGLTIDSINGDFYTHQDEIILDGGVTVFGKALNRKGEVVDVGFDLDIKASAGVGWQEDDEPTGWNYKTDNPTYTSYTTAEAGDIAIESIQFSDGMAFIVDNEELYLRDAQQIIDPSVMKQLLDPNVYIKLLNPYFDKKAAEMEPPEQEFDEPERDYDSRY